MGATLGERLFFLREKHELIQKQMAAIIYCSLRTYQKIERGHLIPSADVIRILSEHFKVSYDYLIKGE